MKRILFILFTLCVFNIAQAQEKAFTFSYGDVTTDFEEASIEASGWRIDALFESPPIGGKIVHGFGIGYIESKADITTTAQTSNFTLKSVPFYYAPKMLFGKKAFKGFIKGAFGFHFSEYNRTGTASDLTTNDGGLYAGVSLGAKIAFNPKVFMNIEYEWAYLSNSFYQDDSITSAIIGVGFNL